MSRTLVGRFAPVNSLRKSFRLSVAMVYNACMLSHSHMRGNYKMQSKLMDATLELVRNRPRHVLLRDIEISTGVPAGWISEFQRGFIKEPSVVRVEALYVFLTGKELDL